MNGEREREAETKKKVWPINTRKSLEVFDESPIRYTKLFRVLSCKRAGSARVANKIIPQ